MRPHPTGIAERDPAGPTKMSGAFQVRAVCVECAGTHTSQVYISYMTRCLALRGILALYFFRELLSKIIIIIILLLLF